METFKFGGKDIQANPKKMLAHCKSEYDSFISKLNNCEGLMNYTVVEIVKNEKEKLIQCSRRFLKKQFKE